MINKNFFEKRHQNLSVSEVLNITGAILDDHIDNDLKIHNIATLDLAKDGDISFYSSNKYKESFLLSNAQFCFVKNEDKHLANKNMVLLIHKNPYYAYCALANELYKIKDTIFSDKNISNNAQIGRNCKIAPNSFVGNNVIIGDNCTIGPNCSITDGCIIGDNVILNSNIAISFSIIKSNVIIHNGSMIGQDGFGSVFYDNKNHKIIQLGIVEIHDNVEIGANCCIDRGAINNTIISQGVKIDNLCQIAHNVKIGKSTVIAGCSAIAGSSEIGQYTQIGGGCNISGHIKVGDFVKIAGMSGVTKNIKNHDVVAGIPARNMMTWLKNNAKLNKL